MKWMRLVGGRGGRVWVGFLFVCGSEGRCVGVCVCVCVTVLGGGVCGPLLVSHGRLQHLHVGPELLQETAGPALPGLGSLAVVHPVDTAVTWRQEGTGGSSGGRGRAGGGKRGHQGLGVEQGGQQGQRGGAENGGSIRVHLSHDLNTFTGHTTTIHDPL